MTGISPADGSPVAVFRALPAGRAPSLVHDAIGPSASVLDLGCGAGRLAHPLADLGHPVVAVDLSPEMLASVRVPCVCADIAGLTLHGTFDAVVLASYLVNLAEGAAYLETARRHVAPAGVVILQRFSPDWVREAFDDAATLDDVTIAVHDFRVDADRFEAIVTYALDDRTWDQPVSAAIIDDADLDAMAATAGLGVVRWLDEFRTWAALTPVQ